ncbi:MAG: lysostaphin resistance A-like protein [Candidatus Hodarchaeota archaeon]
MEIETGLESPEKVEEGMDDDLVSCHYCKKNIKNYFKFGPLYCPFCGGPLNDDILPGKKRSNVLTGKAIWGTKWALLGPIIGFGVMIVATMVPEIVMIFYAVLTAPPSMGIDEILEAVLNALSSPVFISLLSLVELAFIIVPIFILRKYKKTTKEKFLLLGWRPYKNKKYEDPSRKSSKIPPLLRDVCLGTSLAIVMVWAQYGISILNGIIWYPLLGGVEGISDDLLSGGGFWDMIIMVVTMIAIIGPTEEFMFRGLSQQGLEATHGEYKALFISTLIFMAVHVGPVALVSLLSAAYMAFPYFMISSVLCFIYTRTKNLNLMIFIHGIYDAILVIIEYIFQNYTIFTNFLIIITIFAVAWILLEFSLHKFGDRNSVRKI